MELIEPRYITLGSVAIILEGNAGFEVYMANSKKQWISLGAGGGSSGGAASPVVDQGQADSMVL